MPQKLPTKLISTWKKKIQNEFFLIENFHFDKLVLLLLLLLQKKRGKKITYCARENATRIDGRYGKKKNSSGRVLQNNM